LDAWLDPEKATKFLFARPGGEMVRVEIDPRVGGRYSIVVSGSLQLLGGER
jgi:uncharacterized protein YndB with AHSA1/START domain